MIICVFHISYVFLSYLSFVYFRVPYIFTFRGSKKKKKKKKKNKNPPSNNIHVRSIKYRDMLQQISSILRAYIDLEMVEEWKFCKGVATTELHCPTRQRYT